jgi:hypothetical protein
MAGMRSSLLRQRRIIETFSVLSFATGFSVCLHLGEHYTSADWSSRVLGKRFASQHGVLVQRVASTADLQAILVPSGVTRLCSLSFFFVYSGEKK